MAHKSERVLLMKSNYIKLHQEGYSISEIASKYGITSRTVYLNLQAIADENGITRDELLDVPLIGKNRTSNSPNNGTQKFVDVESLKTTFTNVITETETLLQQIDNILQKEED